MFKIFLCLWLLMGLQIPQVFAEQGLSQVLEGVKKRYGNVSGLSVPYTREVITRSMSMLGAQAKRDLAAGVLYFKPPYFLRLDQKKPDAERIIANGDILWWYIPEKKEAHRYQAKDFGRELRLLSDIFRGLGNVSDSFKAALEGNNDNGDWDVLLEPDPPWQEIDRIVLTVTPQHDIRSVRIFNSLGSITRFDLGDFTLGKGFNKDFFEFVAPPGVTVIAGPS